MVLIETGVRKSVHRSKPHCQQPFCYGTTLVLVVVGFRNRGASFGFWLFCMSCTRSFLGVNTGWLEWSVLLLKNFAPWQSIKWIYYRYLSVYTASQLGINYSTFIFFIFLVSVFSSIISPLSKLIKILNFDNVCKHILFYENKLPVFIVKRFWGIYILI